MNSRLFTIEIRDYERGSDDHDITVGRLEHVVARMLEKDGSDGIVIVQERDHTALRQLSS